MNLFTYNSYVYPLNMWKEKRTDEKMLDSYYTRMLRATLNKSWRQHPYNAAALRSPTTHHEDYKN